MPSHPPQSVEQLLQAMVGINTINATYSGKATAEAPLADYLESVARAMGFATRRLPVSGRGDNLLVTFKVADKRPWLMFESHMDTVVVDGMTIDPFAARIEGGKLWGRGSCDTKGTGAAMLWALRQYAADASSNPSGGNIAIAFTIDEEYGMTGVRGLIQDFPKLGFTPVGLIIGEPTMLKPVIAHNGAVRWRVITHGVAAHASNPAKGHSAIHDMMAIIEAIETRYIANLSASHELTGKAQCSINMIRGGSQINIIPARCEIDIDRRVVPGEDPQRVLPEVEAILSSLSAGRPKLRFEQELLFASPPLSTNHNGNLLGIVQRTLSRMKLDGTPLGAAYATDAGDLDRAGIPAVVIGPGDLAQAHTKDEWIDLAQLHRGVELYLELMKSPQ